MAGVLEFHEVIGIESDRESAEARRWSAAAGEKLDKVRDVGVGGLESVKQLGSESLDRTVSAKSRLAERIAERRSQGKGDPALGDVGDEGD